MAKGELANGVGVKIYLTTSGKRYAFIVDDVNFSEEVLAHIKDKNFGEKDPKKRLTLDGHYFKGRKIEIWVK